MAIAMASLSISNSMPLSFRITSITGYNSLNKPSLKVSSKAPFQELFLPLTGTSVNDILTLCDHIFIRLFSGWAEPIWRLYPRGFIELNGDHSRLWIGKFSSSFPPSWPGASSRFNPVIFSNISENETLTVSVTSDSAVIASREFSVAQLGKDISLSSTAMSEGTLTSGSNSITFFFTNRDAFTIESPRTRKRMMAKRSTVQTVPQSKIADHSKPDSKSRDRDDRDKSGAKEKEKEKEQPESHRDKMHRKHSVHASSRDRKSAVHGRVKETPEPESPTKSASTTPEKDKERGPGKETGKKPARSVGPSPNHSDEEGGAEGSGVPARASKARVKRRATHVADTITPVKLKKRLSDTNLNAEAGPRSLEGSQTERPMASSTESTIAVRGENSNASSVRNSSESTTSSKGERSSEFSELKSELKWVIAEKNTKMLEVEALTRKLHDVQIKNVELERQVSKFKAESRTIRRATNVSDHDLKKLEAKNKQLEEETASLKNRGGGSAPTSPIDDRENERLRAEITRLKAELEAKDVLAFMANAKQATRTQANQTYSAELKSQLIESNSIILSQLSKVKQADDVRSEFESTKAKLQSSEKSLAEKTASLKKEAEKTKALEATIASRTAELSSKDTLIAALKADLLDVSSKSSHHSHKLHHSHSSVKHADGKHGSSSDLSDAIKAVKIENLPKQLESVAASKGQVKALVETLGAVQALQDDMATKFTEIKKALTVKEAELKASERRVSLLEDELKALKKSSETETEGLRDEVANAERDLELAINDFELELEELRTANRTLKLDYQAERDEVDALLLEMKRLEERLQNSEKDLEEETERASEATDERKRLEVKVTQLVEQIGGSAQLSSKLQDYETEKGALASKVKELEVKLRELNEAFDEQTRAAEKHRRAAERAEVRLKEVDNERDSATSKLHETEQKLRNSDKQLRDKQGDLESKERSSKRLEEKITRLESDLKDSETKVRTAEDQARSLQKQIRDKEAELTQARPRSSSKSQIEQFAATLQGEKELLSRKVAELEKKVEEKEEQLTKLKSQPPPAVAAPAPIVTPAGVAASAPVPPAATAAPSVPSLGDAGELEKLRELVKEQEAAIKKAVTQGKIQQMKAEKHRRDEYEKSHTDSTQAYEAHIAKLRAEMADIQAKAKAELETADKAGKERREIEELQTRTRLAYDEREKLIQEVFAHLEAIEKGSAVAGLTKQLLEKKPSSQDFRRTKERLQADAVFTRYGNRLEKT